MVITAPPSAMPSPSSEPAPRRPSFEIDGFTELEQIGRGGQASVYRAKRAADGSIVAIKVFDRSLPTRAGRAGGRGEKAALRRFEREVHSLKRISDHSAVVTLLGSGTTENGLNYIVLDHSARGSMADLLPSAGNDAAVLSVDEATVLGVRIAGALERAHRAGLIHCDIKPGNVLAFDAPEGSTDWRLSDFGIATIDSNATENLQLTVVHSAPEVFAGEANTDASDVYALASVVHTGLIGRPPFEPEIGETTPAFMHRVATEPVDDPRAHGVPDAVASVLERALDKDPTRRHSSARVFGLALNQARADLGLDRVAMAITDGDDDEVTHVADLDVLDMTVGDATPSARSRRPRRRSWALVLYALALAVAGIAATMRGGLGIVPDGAQDIASDLVEIIGVDDLDGNGDGDGIGDGDGDGDGNGNNGNANNGDGDGNGGGGDNDNGVGNGNGNGNGNGGGNGGGDGNGRGGPPGGGGGNGGPGGGGGGGGA